MVLVLVSIPVSANAQYGGGAQVGGGGSSLEEQLNLAKEKVANANQTGAYGSGTPMLGTGTQNGGYVEKIFALFTTCNDNSANPKMIELCGKFSLSLNQHLKQLFAENNSTIQQIILLPFSGLSK